MKKFILLTDKVWHDSLFNSLNNRKGESWTRIKTRDEFSRQNLNVLEPNKIFIPHWSFIIPEDIYNYYECIGFHMTDLPFGRGGSPLQNLIVQGLKNTKISALKVDQGIDTGKIYLKAPLSLNGSAKDIFVRSAEVIRIMIEDIIEKSPEPMDQIGDPVNFKRRKPEEGNIFHLTSLDSIYDHIRMLDCDGYPKAFLETNDFKLEFSSASVQADKSIIANVRIFKK